MSNTKFTRGPWRLVKGFGENTFGVQMGICGGFMIDKRANSECNAHLIASAPDMYDELKAIRDIFEAHDAEVFKDSIECLDNVLARARGEANE